MSTKNCNPNGVVVLEDADQPGKYPDRPFVWIDFDDKRIRGEREVIRVIVGPNEDVVTQYRDNNRDFKANFTSRGSCRSGQGDCIFLNEKGKVTKKKKSATIGIPSITYLTNYPEEIIVADHFFEFGPENRKKFATLFL